MIHSPIHKALSTFQSCNLRFLLMGGQACILYGGAEFSRDIDLSIGVDEDNLAALQRAFEQLQANPVFYPDLSADVLMRGHACHFRCQSEGVKGLRIDLMTKLRGCPPFPELWERRSIVNLPEIGEIGLLSLPDLVQAKKTQCEKDWPMIRRLVDTDVMQNLADADEERVTFWLLECRTPETLIRLAASHSDLCNSAVSRRPLLKAALAQDVTRLEEEILAEEKAEKARDKAYWEPLRKELEEWQRQRLR